MTYCQLPAHCQTLPWQSVKDCRHTTPPIGGGSGSDSVSDGGLRRERETRAALRTPIGGDDAYDGLAASRDAPPGPTPLAPVACDHRVTTAANVQVSGARIGGSGTVSRT